MCSPKAPTKTEQVQTTIPDWLKPAVQATTARAQEVGNREYQQYGGQRTADWQPGFDQGRDLITQAGATDPAARNQLDNLTPGAGIGNANVTPLDFNQGQIDKYMNPYIQSVIGSNVDMMNQQFGRDSVDRRMRAAKAGAYGDYGARVEDAVARGDMNRQINNTIFTGLNEGYNKAAGMFENARGAQMSADQFNADFNNRAADTRFQQGLGLAQGYADLADRESARSLSAAGALSDDAARRMAYQQAGLDTQYSDFRDKQLWDQQQVSWLTNILYGNPESVSSTYNTQYSSPLSQVAGLGLAGFGAYNQSKTGTG